MSIDSWLLFAQADPPPEALSSALRKAGVKVEVATTRAAFEAALTSRPVDLIMADADFPGLPLDALRTEVARRARDAQLVVMADVASVGAAIAAVKAGARDYVIKPLIVEDVLFVLQKARATAGVAPAAALPGGDADGTSALPLVGESIAMRAIWALVARAAQSNATVLIGGETGTGKGVVARRIHELSPRRAGPFVDVQVGALPEALLESELFGHEKGAFTGAAVRKPGRVELAEKGTLFLDEIGDISPATQVKLLRLVQERAYERLGGTETRRADVRFVVATHRDLPAMVAKGTFREDLFYRLNVVRITLPPLRDRLEDLPALARHFAAQASQANGVPPVELADSALAVLGAQRWPGNVRQLQNLVERLVVLSDAPVLTEQDVRRDLEEQGFVTSEPSSETLARETLARETLTREALAREPEPLARGGAPTAGAERRSGEMSAIDLKGAVSRAERRQIEKALVKAHGNRDLAARLLGVSRRTLYYKLRLYDMDSTPPG
ncbi:MAG TPA: sigma-54 dependent transcriptional regulator [Polyangia bacterium]